MYTKLDIYICFINTASFINIVTCRRVKLVSHKSCRCRVYFDDARHFLFHCILYAIYIMGRRDRVVVLCQSLMQQVPITIEATSSIASRGEM